MKIVIRADCKVDDKFGETFTKSNKTDLEYLLSDFLVDIGFTNVSVRVEYSTSINQEWDSDSRKK